MKKLVNLILFSLFLKQFRLGASTVSWSKLFHLSMTRFEKKIYFAIGTGKPCISRGLYVGSFFSVCVQYSVLGLYIVSS